MSEYQIGDKAVYPGHGVGEIEAIEYKEINGEKLSFYIIRIIDTGLKVMVPINNVKCTGMRDLVKDEEVDKVYSILEEQDIKVENITWNKRFKDYNERLKSGSIFEVATVLRDLVVLSKTKELSFGEKRMYEMAINLISQEVSYVKKTDQDSVKKEINNILEKG